MQESQILFRSCLLLELYMLCRRHSLENAWQLMPYQEKTTEVLHAFCTKSSVNSSYSSIMENAVNAVHGRDISAVYPAVMKNIFSQISYNNSGRAPQAEQPYCELRYDSYQHPVISSEFNANTTKGYAFETELRSIIGKLSTAQNDDMLLYLMQKYCSTIPSVFSAELSLYEASRLYAAIGLSLYKSNQNKDIKTPVDNLMLICGSFGGIQKYIYSTGHKGALKALKGRSFLLQQYCNSIALGMVSTCNLSPANILYTGGGKFFIVVPDISEIKQHIEKISQDIIEQLLAEYEGQISFQLSMHPFTIHEIHEKGMPAIWDMALSGLQQQKKKPFAQLIKQNQDFWEPYGESGHVILCHHTGRELCADDPESIASAEKEKRIFPDPDNNSKWISAEQYLSIEIGKNLKNAICLVQSNDLSLKYKVPGGFSFQILDTIPRHIQSGQYIIMLNKDLPTSIQHPLFRNYAGGGFDSADDFDTLIEQCQGIQRLGILRMDIDNLGSIFREGLSQSKGMGHTIQLSVMLDFFFSGILNRLYEMEWSTTEGLINKGTIQGETTPVSELMNIVYSGGDDLFIVGIWNILPDIALWINQEFHKFTANNPALSVSAGIALFQQNFPLARAAVYAGMAEKKAKQYQKPNSSSIAKNAITFLDTTLCWNDLEYCRSLHKNLYTWLNTGKNGSTISRSFLHRLSNLHKQFISAKKEKKWSQWRWRACYYLSRSAEQHKVFREEITKLSAELFMNKGRTEKDLIELIQMPISWADYRTRKEKKQ
jgi:CRISPR-associated protein Csm1